MKKLLLLSLALITTSPSLFSQNEKDTLNQPGQDTATPIKADESITLPNSEEEEPTGQESEEEAASIDTGEIDFETPITSPECDEELEKAIEHL